MDPVNKWLTTIIFFMAAVLFVMWHSTGAGRYELAVEKSTLFENHAVVYVLDTKDGEVKAQLVDENDLHYNNTIKSSSQSVLEYERSGYRRRY
jgi:hypothetical protein